MEDSLKQAGEDDAVFVFFAGHGTTIDTPDGKIGHIVPHDASASLSRAQISMERIRESASLTKAKQIFYVMDACYSGLLLVRGENDQTIYDIDFAALQKMVSTRVRNVLTAGDAGQQVLDGGLEGHSVFTGRFLEG